MGNDEQEKKGGGGEQQQQHHPLRIATATTTIYWEVFQQTSDWLYTTYETNERDDENDNDEW